MARRAVLCAAVAGAVLSLVAPVPIASAQPPRRRSKAQAAYRNHPKDGFSCAACTQFRAPAACLIVRGRISPHGWCKFFDMAD